jgi:Ca2+-binding EF-hand superfamily protein
MRRDRFRCCWLAAGLALALTTAVLADAAKSPAPAPSDPPDPPGTTPYMDEFRELFAAWDVNCDGALDKAELAKAFRGADAKAYDYKKDGDKDPLPGASKETTTAKKPDFAEYPDYHFLVQADQDGDGQVSRAEFMTWARDYAVQLKQETDQEIKVAALEVKMKSATTAKEIKALEKELKKEQAAASKISAAATKQMKAFQTAMLHHKKHK